MSKKSKGSSAKKSDKKKTAKPVSQNSVKKSPAKKQAKKSTVKKKVVVKKATAKKAVKPKAKPAPKKSSDPGGKKVLKKASATVVKKAAPAKKMPVAKPVKKAEEKKLKPVKPVIEKKPETKPLKELKVEKVLEAAPAKKVAAEAKNNSSEVLAITNTIPKQEVTPLSASKIASISSSITNPVRKIDSYSVKVEKEPNGKYEMEFLVRSSPEMLYEFLSTPSGLSEWFCDDVNIRNGIYTFIWDGQLQQARLLKTIDDQLVKFQWVDKTDGSYFEFRIQRDDLTNDISLIVTDFADSVGERESAKRLWQSQVEKLLHIIGSIF